MNFFEKEMRMMFEHTGIIQDPKFVGRTMVGILDDNLRVKMQFVSTFIAITMQFRFLLSIAPMVWWIRKP